MVKAYQGSFLRHAFSISVQVVTYTCDQCGVDIYQVGTPDILRKRSYA